MITKFKVGDICRYGYISNGIQDICDPNRYQITKIDGDSYFFSTFGRPKAPEFEYRYSDMRQYWTVETPKFVKKTVWK